MQEQRLVGPRLLPRAGLLKDTLILERQDLVGVKQPHGHRLMRFKSLICSTIKLNEVRSRGL